MINTLSFKQFLNEKVQLTHLEHVEDILLDYGKAGGYRTLSFLEDVFKSLQTGKHNFHTVQAKVDGAPAIVSGWDPESGKFFVATKSLFNKNPKVNYTDADVDANHGHSDGLSSKLKDALKYLPNVIKKGCIVQGDFMYSKSDLKNETIDGVSCVTFQPNTITYAVPTNSKLYKIITGSQIGIIFHTEYNGTSVTDLSAGFEINDNSFHKTKDVYCRTTNVQDVSGSIGFTAKEETEFRKELDRLNKIVNDFDDKKLDFILDDKKLVIRIKAYINSKVRTGKKVSKNEIKDFVDYIYSIFDKETEKLKSEKGKDKKQAEKAEFIKKLRDNFSLLYSFFYWHDDIQVIKNLLIDKLNTIDSPEVPYIRKGNLLEPTDPEGFVIASSRENAVKFVNRSVFSAMNFNLGKMGNM